MATGKGVIQGYTEVEAVDAKEQIIVRARAHGTGSQQEVLLPVVVEIQLLLAKDSLLTTDAGYHSEANLQQLAERKIEALIADNGMRARDERIAEQAEHKTKPDPLWNKTVVAKKTTLFGSADFTYDAHAHVCICPAEEFLYQNGSRIVVNGREGVRFTGAKRVSGPCPVRAQCVRFPERTAVRQVLFFTGRIHKTESHTTRMKRRFDSPAGRGRYRQRIATVEPVFGNRRYNKGLDRFTRRGKASSMGSES